MSFLIPIEQREIEGFDDDYPDEIKILYWKWEWNYFIYRWISLGKVHSMHRVNATHRMVELSLKKASSDDSIL